MFEEFYHVATYTSEGIYNGNVHSTGGGPSLCLRMQGPTEPSNFAQQPKALTASAFAAQQSQPNDANLLSSLSVNNDPRRTGRSGPLVMHNEADNRAAADAEGARQRAAADAEGARQRAAADKEAADARAANDKKYGLGNLSASLKRPIAALQNGNPLCLPNTIPDGIVRLASPTIFGSSIGASLLNNPLAMASGAGEDPSKKLFPGDSGAYEVPTGWEAFGLTSGTTGGSEVEWLNGSDVPGLQPYKPLTEGESQNFSAFPQGTNAPSTVSQGGTDRPSGFSSFVRGASGALSSLAHPMKALEENGNPLPAVVDGAAVAAAVVSLPVDAVVAGGAATIAGFSALVAEF